MQWLVEVAHVVGDHGLIDEILESAGYELKFEGSGTSRRVLSHSKYQAYESASQVYADAKHLAEVLSKLSELEEMTFGLILGAVQSRQPDGTTNKHIFCQLQATLSIAVSASVTASFTPNSALSEEERQKLIEAAEMKVATQRKMSVVRRASAALKRSRVLEVMMLMRVAEPTTTQLAHIVDLVQDECSGDLKKYTNRNQLRRFYHSINHPKVFGLEARHAVSSEEPPPKPMDFAEARTFARKIGAAWLADIERDS